MFDIKNLNRNVEENTEQYLEILEEQLSIHWIEKEEYKIMLKKLFIEYEKNK